MPFSLFDAHASDRLAYEAYRRTHDLPPPLTEQASLPGSSYKSQLRLARRSSRGGSNRERTPWIGFALHMWMAAFGSSIRKSFFFFQSAWKTAGWIIGNRRGMSEKALESRRLPSIFWNNFKLVQIRYSRTKARFQIKLACGFWGLDSQFRTLLRQFGRNCSAIWVRSAR